MKNPSMKLNKSGVGVNRITWIDSVRGIAVVLVVFQHVILHIDRYYDVPGYLIGVNQYLGVMRMPALCLVSGIFAPRALRFSRNIFLKRKVFYFIHLYIVWGIILVNGMSIMAWLEGGSLAGSFKLWVKLLIVADNVLWYFLALAIYYLLFCIAGNKYKWMLFTFSIALYFFMSLANLDQGNVALSIPRYFIFFLVGSYFSNYLISVIEIHSFSVFTVFIIFYSVILVLDERYMLNKFIYPIVPFMGLFTFISFCGIIDRFKISYIVKRVGMETLPIYALHWLLINIALISFSALKIEGLWLSLLSIVSTIVLVILSIGCKRITEPILPFLYGLPRYLKS